jgi:ABC-type dipeptide/oligopeptide/nickel transport system permease subunit
MAREAQRFFANRGSLVGTLLICILLAIVGLRPWLSSKNGNTLDIDHGLTLRGAPLPPSAESPLGTDDLGRDVWARIADGAGNSLEIATLATLLSLVIGLAIGLVAGYAGGWVDHALMRLVDLVLAFPFLLLAILLAALLRKADLSSTIAPVVLILGGVGWTTIARVIRGKAMAVTRSEMILAARGLGASPARIVLRHVLPNVAGIVTVVTALGFAQNLLAEAVLSYLGLGPTTTTWGHMLFEGRSYYRTAPWLVIAPALAILVAVIAFNLVGEGLRDAFDPKDPA